MRAINMIATLLIVLPVLVFNSYGQNIGINTTGGIADPSALLDINASNKGVLIPNVSLISNTDGATISSPAASLLVYNTNASMTNGAGKGYYYNSGTPASPVWINMLTPVTASTSGAGDWTLVGVASSTSGFSGGFVTTGYTMVSGKEYLAIAMAGGSPTMSDAVAVFGPISNNGVAAGYASYVTLFSPIINGTSAEGWAIISGKLKNSSITTTANLGVNGTFGGGSNDPVIAVKGTGEIGYNDWGPFNAYSMYLFER